MAASANQTTGFWQAIGQKMVIGFVWWLAQPYILALGPAASTVINGILAVYLITSIMGIDIEGSKGKYLKIALLVFLALPIFTATRDAVKGISKAVFQSDRPFQSAQDRVTFSGQQLSDILNVKDPMVLLVRMQAIADTLGHRKENEALKMMTAIRDTMLQDIAAGRSIDLTPEGKYDQRFEKVAEISTSIREWRAKQQNVTGSDLWTRLAERPLFPLLAVIGAALILLSFTSWGGKHDLWKIGVPMTIGFTIASVFVSNKMTSKDIKQTITEPKKSQQFVRNTSEYLTETTLGALKGAGEGYEAGTKTAGTGIADLSSDAASELVSGTYAFITGAYYKSGKKIEAEAKKQSKQGLRPAPPKRQPSNAPPEIKTTYIARRDTSIRVYYLKPGDEKKIMEKKEWFENRYSEYRMLAISPEHGNLGAEHLPKSLPFNKGWETSLIKGWEGKNYDRLTVRRPKVDENGRSLQPVWVAVALIK